MVIWYGAVCLSKLVTCSWALNNSVFKLHYLHFMMENVFRFGMDFKTVLYTLSYFYAWNCYENVERKILESCATPNWSKGSVGQKETRSQIQSPRSSIPNPESQVPDPKSQILNPESRVSDSKSPPLQFLFGMVWYGLVWYSLVWFGTVWYGLVRGKIK